MCEPFRLSLSSPHPQSSKRISRILCLSSWTAIYLSLSVFPCVSIIHSHPQLQQTCKSFCCSLSSPSSSFICRTPEGIERELTNESILTNSIIYYYSHYVSPFRSHLCIVYAILLYRSQANLYLLASLHVQAAV